MHIQAVSSLRPSAPRKVALRQPSIPVTFGTEKQTPTPPGHSLPQAVYDGFVGHFNLLPKTITGEKRELFTAPGELSSILNRLGHQTAARRLLEAALEGTLIDYVPNANAYGRHPTIRIVLPRGAGILQLRETRDKMHDPEETNSEGNLSFELMRYNNVGQQTPSAPSSDDENMVLALAYCFAPEGDDPINKARKDALQRAMVERGLHQPVQNSDVPKPPLAVEPQDPGLLRRLLKALFGK